MFTYLHCYMPETWDAQVRAGLIDDTSGIRFCQSIDVEERLRFNNLARVGGRLYEIVRERRCPLYIDRLQGGCYFEGYDYDMGLIGEYRRLLGDKFWGFQMHEWMSNTASDIGKLTRGGCPAWTEEAITETIRRTFPFPHLFLEAMTAREMADFGQPRTWQDFLRMTGTMFDRRMAYTGGMLVPADSYYLAYPLELRAGVKRIMPEIGAQTPDTRFQLAFARGMAKGAGIPFGAYYEPWGGYPFSACNYHREGFNEWNIRQGVDFPFETKGEGGGSSRSLQKRMHLYAYMAGASFMAEEWGMCNTFYDWHDFELTPYGQVKLDFLNFTRRYPDVGELMAPVAIVLPAELDVVENIGSETDQYVGYPAEGGLAARLREVRRVLRDVFTESAPMVGTETCNLRNHLLPDAVDVVTADYFKPEKNDYRYIVDLTGDPAFRAAHPNVIGPDELSEALDRALPVKVSGGLHHMVNRRADGRCYLTIFNHSGISRTVADGEQVIPGAGRTVTVTLKDNRTLTVLEGDASVVKEGGEYRVTVPAGGWCFARF
ncbi:MAG: hypothetical protein MJ192_04580 [Clostridia bacterium]|nr:hypothetical protein [Clostridia bacterium]